MNNFLTKVAIKITSWVGTMYCALVFACLTFVSLPAVIASHDVVLIIQWVGSVFLQLFLLPIIMVGQNLSSARTEKIISETHDAVIEELAAVKAVMVALHVKVDGMDNSEVNVDVTNISIHEDATVA